MTIGIVLSKPPTYSETFILNKIKGLQVQGYDVKLFVQKIDVKFNLCDTKSAPKVYSKNLFLQFIEFLKVLFIFFFNIKVFIRFFKLEKKSNRPIKQLLKNGYNNAHILSSKVDWLHFAFATMALQSEHVAKAINAKMAVSCRGFDLDVYPLKHPKAYTLLWKNVDKLHCISNYMFQRAIVLGYHPMQNNMIISPAIDLTEFVATLNKTNSKRLEITTIGRLHWIKGITDTLEALSLLKQKGILFNYTIIGEGTEFYSLKFAVHQLNLDNEVKFLGKLNKNSIINILDQTDIYIQYSFSEGFCNAVLEAQAMGCLCVVSDGGALSENIIHEETGWIVEKRNPLSLYNTIIKVINLSDSIKTNIRLNAKTRLVKEFDIKEQWKKFNLFYE